jgi:hypothetical protein
MGLVFLLALGLYKDAVSAASPSAANPSVPFGQGGSHGPGHETSLLVVAYSAGPKLVNAAFLTLGSEPSRFPSIALVMLHPFPLASLAKDSLD